MLNGKSGNLLLMSQQSVAKKFVFHEKIDKEFIFNLYEYDYVYVAEVFQTSLECFDTDMARFRDSFASGDIDELRKAVHKIKPVFGYTGLLEFQDQLAKFEKQCEMQTSTEPLAADFRGLLQMLDEGKHILERELARLNAFTS